MSDAPMTMSQFASKDDMLDAVIKSVTERLNSTMDDTYVELPQDDVRCLLLELKRLRSGMAVVKAMTEKAIAKLDGDGSTDH